MRVNISKDQLVEIKKIFLYFGFCLLLSGCFQSTAMVGPAITVASTQNIYQAGFSYSAGKVVQNETGMSTVEHLSKLIDNDKAKHQNNIHKDLVNLVNNNLAKARIEKDFVILVRKNIEKTREKINLDN